MKTILRAFVLISAAAAAQAERPEDFAYRIHLDAAPGLNVVALDETIYRAASTHDLRDLRIFDGSGAALALARLPAPPARPGPARDVLMVALPADAPERDRMLADFKLRIERQGDRSVVELTPAAAPAATPPDAGGFLLDARSLRNVDGELQLQFAADAPDFAGVINVLGSDDLFNWRPIGGGALVRNRRLGDTIERSTFPLTRVPSFVRLVWPDKQAPRLASARFVERPAAPALPRAALAVVRAEAANSWFVDVPAALPVVRIAVRAPVENVAVRVRVFRYDDAPATARVRPALRPRRAPERWIAEGGARDVFRLQRDGQWIESAPFALSARTTQLRIDALDGAGFGDALPIVEAEWQPQRYVFAASAPPYLLAVGRDDKDLKHGPTLDLRAVLPQDDPAGITLPVARAAVAPVASPGSATSGAEGSARETSRSRYVLWGVLCVAVAALAFMAWKLAAQFKRAPATTTGDDTAR